MLVGSHPYLCNGVVPAAPANTAPNASAQTTTTTASKSAAGSATDFSIAAIMAREDASSRESSIRSASKFKYIYRLPLIGKSFYKGNQDNPYQLTEKLSNKL